MNAVDPLSSAADFCTYWGDGGMFYCFFAGAAADVPLFKKYTPLARDTAPEHEHE